MIRPAFKHIHLNTSHAVRQTDRGLREGIVGSLKYMRRWVHQTLSLHLLPNGKPEAIGPTEESGMENWIRITHCTPETTAFSRRRLGRSLSQEPSHRTEAVLSTEGTKFQCLWALTWSTAQAKPSCRGRARWCDRGQAHDSPEHAPPTTTPLIKEKTYKKTYIRKTSCCLSPTILTFKTSLSTKSAKSFKNNLWTNRKHLLMAWSHTPAPRKERG